VVPAVREAGVAGTCAMCAVPTLCGLSAASCDGRPDDVAGPAAVRVAGGAAGPEAAHAVTAHPEIRVTASAVAILASRTVFDNSQIWLDQGGFAGAGGSL
jgi:hypothetical protein